MNGFEIPLAGVSTTFQTTILNVVYTLTLQWRNAAGLWFLDIADASANPIVSGLPLVTGADLLEQYGYLEFGFELWVQSDVNPDDLPTYENLGTSSHLYVVTP
ncbi:phage baseplate plug family protein [Dyella mobilis]|uniref:Cyanophage baseplate Pam3 plug gp18 domain-containing protein n=1 Tax=Dyella mobilis TaxID=1849582 RepID=A0ABS2KKX6_9GAMM|nr:hypothetical protein [Dyella mobilis]MBM7131548.1 hypothetical protein [Dyella mobilis]GLQ96481.1 hypothetical protein GCM10007863_08990 [Dyella mobilis]